MWKGRNQDRASGREGDVSLIIDPGNFPVRKHIGVAVLLGRIQNKGKLMETD